MRGSIAERNASFWAVTIITKDNASSTKLQTNGCIVAKKQTTCCDWFKTLQWEVVKGGPKKDAIITNQVATETGVSARMIAATVIPE